MKRLWFHIEQEPVAEIQLKGFLMGEWGYYWHLLNVSFGV